MHFVVPPVSRLSSSPPKIVSSLATHARAFGRPLAIRLFNTAASALARRRQGRSRAAFAAVAIAICTLASPSIARAELIDLGSGLIYDTVQDLTWVQEIGPNGFEDHESANAWVESFIFGGYDDWRLPRFTPGGSMAESSEVARLLEPLGWLASDVDFEYYEFGTFGPFTNFANGTPFQTFWLDLDSRLGWHSQYVFDPISDGNEPYARVWAVREGRASVPEPTTMLLTLLGVGGLATMRRRTASARASGTTLRA